MSLKASPYNIITPRQFVQFYIFFITQYLIEISIKSNLPVEIIVVCYPKLSNFHLDYLVFLGLQSHLSMIGHLFKQHLLSVFFKVHVSQKMHYLTSTFLSSTDKIYFAMQRFNFTIVSNTIHAVSNTVFYITKERNYQVPRSVNLLCHLCFLSPTERQEVGNLIQIINAFK